MGVEKRRERTLVSYSKSVCANVRGISDFSFYATFPTLILIQR